MTSEIKNLRNKIEELRSQIREEAKKAVVKFLENSDRFIVFRAYVPAFNDGDPCLPVIEVVGLTGTWEGDYYLDSRGGIHTSWDLDPEDLPEKDQELVKRAVSEDYVQTLTEDEEAIISLVYDAYEELVSMWDVEGSIQLKDGHFRIFTSTYDCGY